MSRRIVRVCGAAQLAPNREEGGDPLTNLRNETAEPLSNPPADGASLSNVGTEPLSNLDGEPLSNLGAESAKPLSDL